MKKSILLIEDDEDLGETLAAYLDMHYFFVVRAKTTKESLLKLRNQEFFCVLVDLKLKEGSGEDVIQYIRENSNPNFQKNVPIFVVSGNISPKSLQKIQKHINGAFVKPFSMDSLLEKLKALDKKSA
jgi:DNA-binding response OmpR family regulator